MYFQKPLMMWLFETHVASQRLPLRRLELPRAGQLFISSFHVSYTYVYCHPVSGNLNQTL